jgi:uncharacterized protein
MTKEHILKYLKNNEEYLEKEYGVKKIALFGSYARGDAVKESDIDLLIEVENKEFKNRYLLKKFLKNEFNKDIDIFYFDSLKTFIRDNIQEDLIYV